MKKVFLDSDVIIEFLTDLTARSEFITAILTLAEEKHIKVFISPFIYSELYSRYKYKDGHKKIIEKLRKLDMISRSLRVNNKIIRQALNADFNDFDTSLNYYIVRGNKKIDAIVTNHVENYANSKITIFTPETYLTTLRNINNT
jgi:predicted nucleic acid-binding protein